MLSLVDLKTIPGILPSLPAPREALPFSRLEGGVLCGALTEVSNAAGGGKTEFVLRFLAENPALRVAWIENEFTIYPCAFPQAGVALNRVLFVEAGAESMWAAHQILRSRLFKIVVLSGNGEIDEIALRRLQIAAEQSSVSVILLRQESIKGAAWPIALRVKINNNQRGST